MSSKSKKNSKDFSYLQKLQEKYYPDRKSSPTKSDSMPNVFPSLKTLQEMVENPTETNPENTSSELENVSKSEPIPDKSHSIRYSVQQQRLLAQKEMAKEEEIEPISFGGIFVILIGAVIFSTIYSTDQKKYSGIDMANILSTFSKLKSIEDYINDEKVKPIKIIADEWNAIQILFNHYQNIFYKYFYLFFQSDGAFDYNSESLVSKFFRLFQVPNKKLLPPISAQFNPRTLVIDLDTICHSLWSRNEGNERCMRPYYHEFISRMAMGGWEIVIFGSNHEEFDWVESPDFAKLDGKGYVQHYLWIKDSYYFNGHRCKDLSRLNRDINRCIIIDSDTRNVQMYPRNCILLNKWKGSNDDDDCLLKICEFLEYINKADVYDTRLILDDYRGKDISEEFRRRYYAAISELNQLQKLHKNGMSGEQIEGYVEDDEGDEEYEEDEEYENVVA